MKKLLLLTGLILPTVAAAQIRYVDVLKIGKKGCVEATRKIIHNPSGTIDYSRTDLYVSGRDVPIELNDSELKDVINGFKSVLRADYVKKNGFTKEVFFAHQKLSAAGIGADGEPTFVVSIQGTLAMFVVSTLSASNSSCPYNKPEFEELIELLQDALDAKNLKP